LSEYAPPKRKKCKASRPRKSVTFSDNIAMVSAMDHYITDTDTCSGYVSDEEEKYKYQRGAYSDKLRNTLVKLL
jgi:hypothetical protein